MQLAEYLKRVNKKETLKQSTIVAQKMYYMGMYRSYMFQLYAMCYIDDPTKFNASQIYGNISDLKISGMSNISGRVLLNTAQVSYALCKNKDNPEATNFLLLLYKVLKYRELSRELDSLWDENNYSCDCAQQKVSLNLKLVGPMFCSKGVYKIGAGTLSCFHPGYKVVENNINNFLWDLGMKELGIPKCDWYADGVFDSQLSHQEEIDNMCLFFDGVVLPSSGKYTKTLEDWLFKHKWSSEGWTTVRQGLLNYLYYGYSDEIFAYESKLVENENVIAVVENKVYLKEAIKNYHIPVSLFSVLADEKDELMCNASMLDGVTGEFYSTGYLDSNNIKYVGCPVLLHTSVKETELFYDLEQVDLKHDTWFVDRAVDFLFADNVDYDDVKLSELGTLIYKIVQDSYVGKLVGSIELTEDVSIQDIEVAKTQVMKVL